VGVESDTDCNGCEELRLWPTRVLGVNGGLTPEDDRLLLRLPLCKLHDGGRVHGQKLRLKVSSKASSSGEDASYVQVSWNVTLDCREGELLRSRPRIPWNSGEKQEVFRSEKVQLLVHLPNQDGVTLVDDDAVFGVLLGCRQQVLLERGSRHPFEGDAWICQCLLFRVERLVVWYKIGVLQDQTHHNLLLLVLRIQRIQGEEMSEV